MNCSYSFLGYHGQGTLHFEVRDGVTSFRLYVNGISVDTSEMKAGKAYALDISELVRNGENTIQVSNIAPNDLKEAVTVCIPYPEVIAGTPAEEGISEQALEMISDLIQGDIDNGFTSAQLAVVRNGRLVYENAWGKTNSYLPDGTPNADSPMVTTQTMYDLASVTKMFSANYALQKLVTDGKVDLDAKITEFLGEAFAEKTKLFSEEDAAADLDTIKKWKSELTVRDLLRHQGGFMADQKYSSPKLYK
ncbi:MAG: serine hydrolase, partial [Lachnospiraceae bacterium]|nr:serine hydrolase [Lachnospiraceae bacterium]